MVAVDDEPAAGRRDGGRRRLRGRVEVPLLNAGVQGFWRLVVIGFGEGLRRTAHLFGGVDRNRVCCDRLPGITFGHHLVDDGPDVVDLRVLESLQILPGEGGRDCTAFRASGAVGRQDGLELPVSEGVDQRAALSGLFLCV